MCSFDPNDLNNQVNPASEEINESSASEGCSSDLGANNNTGGNSCSSHKGHIEPQPNWGVGGLSIDNPEENN